MESVSRNVVPGCPNAGNPYHECTEICLERLNSGDSHKKEKTFFGFGKRTPSRETSSPGSPARGNRSPLANYFGKKKVGSETSSSSTTDNSNVNFLSRLSPLQERKNEPENKVHSVPISPSHAVFSAEDYFARRTDSRGSEDDDMSPRPFATQRPKTPEHPLRTPQHKPLTPQHRSDPRPWALQEDPIAQEIRPWTPERPSNTSHSRPRTPKHESAATGRRPQTPETRPRTPTHESAGTGRKPQTPETRPRTPTHESLGTGRRPQTPDTRPRTPTHESAGTERRPQTPETRPRTPTYESAGTGRRPQTPETRPRTPTYESAGTGRRPQTPETRPRTPTHESAGTGRRPQTPETRPRTSIHESAAIRRRPQTPETRPRTSQHRGRSPEFMERSPGLRSKTPEPQPTYFEPLSRTKSRSKTPEPSPRIHQTQPSFSKYLVHRGRSPDHMEKYSPTQRSPAYNYLKAESVYSDNDNESVLLYPELILSPQERPLSRPITPIRSGYETPTKQKEQFDQLDDSASTDDDKFSFVDEDEDSSALFYPEINKSESSTSTHHESRTSRSETEEQDKPNYELAKLTEEPNESRDELLSILSESQVSVGDYKVRASVSATLQLIFDKHGDIASTSKLNSLATRSYYLDMLASMVLELQTTPLKHLKETRVEEMVAIVRDVESVKIKVGWLKPVLEEILEAVKHYDHHEKSKVEKEMWERHVLLARQEMEKQVKELKEKEKKMKEWRDGITEMAGKLGTLDMRKARLDKSLEFLCSKVDKFQGKSVLQGIL